MTLLELLGKPEILDELIYTDIEVDELVEELLMKEQVLNEYRMGTKKGAVVRGVGMSIATGGAATPFVLGSLFYRQHMSRAAKACKEAVPKEECMQKFAAEANKKKKEAIKKNMKLCDKARSPKKCKKKAEKAIKKAEARIKKYTQRAAKAKMKFKDY